VIVDIEQKAHMIDQTVSTDLPVRGVVRQLYDAAVKANSDKPLCLTAAQELIKRTNRGDYVFVLTGFAIPPINVPETDGPPGAAVLIDALKAIGLEPVLITDELCSRAVKAATPETKVLEFPVDSKQARNKAGQLLHEYNPSALVAIERPGWNRKREYHNMRGLNISNTVGKTDFLAASARNRGILIIGVADGGNELGCGLISQTVRKHVPYGSKCQCPCNSGIAAATRADVLVVGGVSNWGAYGIAACLSLLKGIPYTHDRKAEMQLLNRIVKAGAIDSILKEPKPYVDGLAPSINGLVVDLISAITNA
jgi:hypothetical protein